MKKLFIFLILLSFFSQSSRAKVWDYVDHDLWKAGAITNGIVTTVSTLGLAYHILRYTKTKEVLEEKKTELTEQEFHDITKSNMKHEIWAWAFGSLAIIGFGNTILCLIGLNNTGKNVESKIETSEISIQTPEIKSKRIERYEIILELANVVIKDKVKSKTGSYPTYRQIRNHIRKKARTDNSYKDLYLKIKTKLNVNELKSNEVNYMNNKIRKAIRFLGLYKIKPEKAITDNTESFFSDKLTLKKRRKILASVFG